MEYFIIEHPTQGVLVDLDWTPSGRQFGRFSFTGGRDDERVHRFFGKEQAFRDRDRIEPETVRVRCVVRSSVDDGTYGGAWPVVERDDPEPVPDEPEPDYDFFDPKPDPNIIELKGDGPNGPWTMEVVVGVPPTCAICDRPIDGKEREQGAWKLHTASPICEGCVERYWTGGQRKPVGGAE